MKRFLKIAGGIVATIVLTLIIAPWLINLNGYKPQIETQASEKLGRKVSIEGAIKLVLFPSPGITIEGLHIANAPQAKVSDMAKIDEVSVYIAWLPLLFKEIRVDQFNLVRPEIALETFEGGKNNWDDLVEKSSKEEPEDQTAGQEGFAPNISLKDVRIYEGSLTYYEKHKASSHLEHLNVRFSADNLTGPYWVKGDLDFEKEPLHFEGNLGIYSPDKPTDLKATLTYSGHQINLEGKTNLTEPSFQGNVAGEINGLVFGMKGSSLDQRISVTGALGATSKLISLTNLKAVVGNAQPTGHIKIELEKKPIPYELSLKQLPGDSKLFLQGLIMPDSPYKGELKMTSAQFDQLLEWLNVSVQGLVNPRKLKSLSLHTHFAIDPSKEVRFSNLALKIHEAQIAGDFNYKAPLIGMNLKTPSVTSWLNLLDIDSKHKLGALAVKGQAQKGEEDYKVDITLGLADGHLGFVGNIKPTLVYNLKTTIKHPNFNALLKAVGQDLGSLRIGRTELSSHVSGTKSQVTLKDIKGTITPQGQPLAIAGTASVDLSGAKPKITADLQLGKIVWEHFWAAAAPAPMPPQWQFVLVSAKTTTAAPRKGSSFKGWSREVVDLSALKSFDANVTLKADTLRVASHDLNQLRTTARLTNGNFVVPDFKAVVYGGQAGGDFNLSTASRAPEIKGNIHLRNANLQRLLSEGFDVNVKGGTLNFDMGIETQGHSVYDWVSHLGGKAKLEARDGAIEGFDLTSISKNLKNLGSLEGLTGLVTGSFAKGHTPFSYFGGTFNIKEGIIQTNDLALKSPVATGQGKGIINLLQWVMNIRSDFTLVDFEKAPSFGVELKGPLDAPQRHIDMGALQSYLFRKTGGKFLNRFLSAKDPKNAILPGIADLLMPDSGGEQEKSSTTKKGSTGKDTSQKKGQDKNSNSPEELIGNVLKGLF